MGNNKKIPVNIRVMVTEQFMKTFQNCAKNIFMVTISISFIISGDTLTEEEVMLLINAADKDGDGSLDFEEFVKIMMDK